MRRFARICIGITLGFCMLIDGALGEAAISGCCDVYYLDAEGRIVLPRPDPKLWLPIVVFVLLQGALVLGFIRLRAPSGDQISLFGDDTSEGGR